MDCIKLHILSPEGTLAEVMAEAVTLPGAAGPFMVLKDHAPLLSALEKGKIVWRSEGQEESLEIKEGFVEVGNNEIKACVEA